MRPDGTTQACPSGAASCPPGEGLYLHQGLRNSTWVTIDRRCYDPSEGKATPTVTPAIVATAFQRIPLPKLASSSEPAGKTLINFDTIFHTNSTPLHRRLTLLGQRVQLTITPASFTWHYGDGSTQTTTTPGNPYPAKTITHRYQHTARLQHHLTTTWTAQWRLNNGPWQEVPGTVTTTGPATPLRIVEATPALSGLGH